MGGKKHAIKHSPSEPPREGRFREILYATDFSAEAPAAVPYALSLAQEHQAHLTLLHVVQEASGPDFVRPDEVEASAVQQMRDLVPEVAELWYEPHSAVGKGEPAEAILEAAIESKSDLIVLGVRKPGGIPGGTSASLGRGTQGDCACHLPGSHGSRMNGTGLRG